VGVSLDTHTAARSEPDPVLRAFAEEVGADGPVAVEGARTRFALGGPLDAGTRILHAPAGIVAHQPEEMTVRVRAGTPVADLHRELATRGQRTALPERGGTVGGAIATGENALCVGGVGRIRHALLEARYVSAEGRLITGGGPTVKNVTGFDLPRVLVGSLGTLGLLAEVILRTNPVPAISRWLAADGADPFAVDQRLFAPAAVLWDGAQVWVRLEGHGVDVETEQAGLRDLGDFAEGDGPPALPPHRWSLRPSALRDLDRGATGAFVASIGVGTVFASRPQPARAPDPVARAVAGRLKAALDPTGRLAPGRDPATPVASATRGTPTGRATPAT
jgi:glycolate oxidase FAD binding subunit